MTTTPKPTFTDSPYVRSHMKAPRGRGSWAFQASRSTMAFDRDLVGEVRFFSGTLGEAKAQAAVAFAGAEMVAVLP